MVSISELAAAAESLFTTLQYIKQTFRHELQQSTEGAGVWKKPYLVQA